jgi:Ca2+-binding RTX toxin-like protein
MVEMVTTKLMEEAEMLKCMVATEMLGGPGNDQLYAGTGTDTLIGGPGADYFNCGTQTGTGGSPSSAVILDFNPSEGDTKASNCKYVFTVGGAPAAP